MLAHGPTLEQLHALGLHGLAKGFQGTENRAEARGSITRMAGLLLEYETTPAPAENSLNARQGRAPCRHQASVPRTSYQIPARAGSRPVSQTRRLRWIAERRNLLITGAAGLGKSWLACALGQKACGKTSPFSNPACPGWFADLAIAHGDARYPRLLRSIARAKLLIWMTGGPEALTPEQARDLLEISKTATTRESLHHHAARFRRPIGTT